VNSPILSPEQFGDAELASWLGQCIASCYPARAAENPWQYADRRVWLDGKATADPGFYNSAKTPFVRRMQEIGAAPAVDPLTGHFVHTYVGMKSSRSGFTEGALNIIRWMPQHQPGHVLYAIDSKDEVKAISKERLKPTLERILDENQLPGNPDDFGIYWIFLRNMTIRLGGSYSEGLFANKWLRKIFLDECEVMSQDVGGSTPIDLADSRGTTVDDFQKFLLSKPKVPGTRFHQEYLAGTQEKFYVPCPHCGHRQELVWGDGTAEGIKYTQCKGLDGRYDLNRVLEETYYQCAGAQRCHIDYIDQREMVAQGEWRITNPHATPGIVSQQISDLYSPFKKVSWGNLALLWIKAQKSLTAIQHFWNNYMGLPFEAKKVSISVGDLLACRSGLIDTSGQRATPIYHMGELPWQPHLLLATSDIQDEVMKWMVWAYRGIVLNFRQPNQTVRYECALIDYGKTLGYDDLANLLTRPYLVRGGDGVPCFAAQGLVDSGYATFATYDFCIANGNWFPTKGIGASTSGQLVVQKERTHNGSDFLRYDYEDHSIKVAFYEDRIKRRREPRLYLPSDLEDERHTELVSELLSERQIVEKVDGRDRLKWKAKCNGAPNDWGDSGKMGAVVGLTILLPTIEEIALGEASEAAAGKH
jgi:phage terminase large subunit GpA-like protein